MIGVEEEDQIQRIDQRRVRLKLVVRLAEHHVQEILCVPLPRVRVLDVVAQLLAVGIGSNGADLGHDARGRFDESLLVLNLQQLRIIAAQRIEHRGQHGHRRRVGRKEAEVLLYFFAQHLVLGQQRTELV